MITAFWYEPGFTGRVCGWLALGTSANGDLLSSGLVASVSLRPFRRQVRRQRIACATGMTIEIGRPERSSRIEVRMPEPIAVPRRSSKLSIGVIRACRARWSAPAPAARSRRTPRCRSRTSAGWSAMNFLAAACDASMRVGLTSSAPHRARHIHREDHRGARRGERHHRRRPRHREDQDRHRDQQQGRRHMPAPAHRPAHRRLDDRQVGVAHHRALAAPQDPDIEPGERSARAPATTALRAR